MIKLSGGESKKIPKICNQEEEKKLESRKAERKSVEYAAGTFSAMPIHLRHYCLWGGDCHTSNRDPLGQLALLSTNSNKPLSDTFLLPSSIFGNFA